MATIEPRSKSEHAKLAAALAKFTREDPTLKVQRDPMTGQTLLRGMGELHLDIIMDRMEREFGVQANLGKPQVAYKETILTPAEGEGKYIRQTGGKGMYGHCRISVEPLPRGRGFEFADATRGGVIPREFIGDIETGIRESMEAGLAAGFPMTDLKAVLLDGSYHEVDSNPIAFKIAGSLAFREAGRKASPCHPRAHHVPRGRQPGRVPRRHRRGHQLPARAASRAWRCGAAPGSSGSTSRSPRCSGTPPCSGRSPRAAASSPWSSSGTRGRRRPSRNRSSPGSKGDCPFRGRDIMHTAKPTGGK